MYVGEDHFRCKMRRSIEVKYLIKQLSERDIQQKNSDTAFSVANSIHIFGMYFEI